MKKNIIYISTIIILLFTVLLGIYFSNNRNTSVFKKHINKQFYNNSKGSLKTFKHDHNTIINDDLIYNSSPSDLFLNTDYSIQNKVIFNLGNRSLNGDIKSFKRLLALYKNSDGAYAENIYSYIYEIFQKNPSFFFDNITALGDNIELKVYITIFIHHKELQIDQYIKYGIKTQRFINIYKEFKINPELMAQKAFNST